MIEFSLTWNQLTAALLFMFGGVTGLCMWCSSWAYLKGLERSDKKLRQMQSDVTRLHKQLDHIEQHTQPLQYL